MLVMNTATRARINAALAADGLRLARDNEAGWSKKFEGVSIWVTDEVKSAGGDTYEAQHALQAADAETARVMAERAQPTMTTTEMIAFIEARTANVAPAEPVATTIETLIASTKIAITNALNELPQYAEQISAMAIDLAKVQHPKLVVYILQDLEAMHEGRYE